MVAQIGAFAGAGVAVAGAEFNEFLTRFVLERTEDARSAVVRNGFQPEREVLTGLGPVAARIPKARSQRRGSGGVSLLVPPRARRVKSPG